MSKNIFHRIFAGMMISAISSVVSAYACGGPVTGVSVDRGGNVWAANIAGISWLLICNSNGKLNGFSGETCKYMHSSLLAAQMAQKIVTLYFDDQRSCLTHPVWEAVENNGLYFMVINS